MQGRTTNLIGGFLETLLALRRLAWASPIRAWRYRRQAQGLSLPQHFPPSLARGRKAEGERLLDGYLDFHGEVHEFHEKSWRFPKASLACLQHLHGFTWLHDLKALTSPHAQEATAAMVLDWCAQHKRFTGPAFAPAALADRVSTWLSLFDFISAPMTAEQKATFLGHLWGQARHIQKAFPLGARGATRFALLRAWIYADLCLGLDEAMAGGWVRLIKTISQERLADGGMRSVGVTPTRLILETLVEVRAALLHFSFKTPPALDLCIKALAQLLRAMTFSDGSLSNLGALAPHTNLERLLALSHASLDEQAPKLSFPQSGFERLQVKRGLLLVNSCAYNSKQATALDLSAHHAAPMAFEFAFGKQKLIVNCGSHPGDLNLANQTASTAAHSLPHLENLNAIALVKDRASGRLHPFMSAKEQQKASFELTREDKPGQQSLRMRHGFYLLRQKALLSRHLQLEQDGEVLRGRETIEAQKHNILCLRFHLHPSLSARLKGDFVQLKLPNGRSWRFALKLVQASGLTWQETRQASPDMKQGPEIRDAENQGANDAAPNPIPASLTFALEPSLHLAQGRAQPSQQICLRMACEPGTSHLDWCLSAEGRAARQVL